MTADLLSYVEALTAPEVDRKAQLEATIERGMQTFVEVGLALMEIRDGRLYRAEYGTFEEYCQERWGWERRHAYRLIDAAAAVENVSNWTQNQVPANEAQARPLTSLPPAQQREAWERVLETAPNGKITAAIVTQAAKEIRQERTEQRRQERIEKIASWIAKHRRIEATTRVGNATYQTISVAVPTDVLRRSVSTASVIDVSQEAA